MSYTDIGRKTGADLYYYSRALESTGPAELFAGVGLAPALTQTDHALMGDIAMCASRSLWSARDAWTSTPPVWNGPAGLDDSIVWQGRLHSMSESDARSWARSLSLAGMVADVVAHRSLETGALAPLSSSSLPDSLLSAALVLRSNLAAQQIPDQGAPLWTLPSKPLYVTGTPPTLSSGGMPTLIGAVDESVASATATRLLDSLVRMADMGRLGHDLLAEPLRLAVDCIDECCRSVKAAVSVWPGMTTAESDYRGVWESTDGSDVYADAHAVNWCAVSPGESGSAAAGLDAAFAWEPLYMTDTLVGGVLARVRPGHVNGWTVGIGAACLERERAAAVFRTVVEHREELGEADSDGYVGIVSSEHCDIARADRRSTASYGGCAAAHPSRAFLLTGPSYLELGWYRDGQGRVRRGFTGGKARLKFQVRAQHSTFRGWRCYGGRLTEDSIVSGSDESSVVAVDNTSAWGVLDFSVVDPSAGGLASPAVLSLATSDVLDLAARAVPRAAQLFAGLDGGSASAWAARLPAFLPGWGAIPEPDLPEVPVDPSPGQGRTGTWPAIRSLPDPLSGEVCEESQESVALEDAQGHPYTVFPYQSRTALVSVWDAERWRACKLFAGVTLDTNWQGDDIGTTGNNGCLLFNRGFHPFQGLRPDA